jgi:hypothetical protein
MTKSGNKRIVAVYEQVAFSTAGWTNGGKQDGEAGVIYPAMGVWDEWQL